MKAFNPHMSAKVRSKALRRACHDMPGCTLRIGTFVGKSCSTPDTLVDAHLDGLAPSLGKGTSTKVSDLNMVAACYSCHEIIAGVDQKTLTKIIENYPAAALARIHGAHQETLAQWLSMGLLVIPDGEIIE